MTCRRAALWLFVCLSVSAGPVLPAPTSECPSGTPEGQQVFVLSDSDCAEFYICSNGVPRLLTCPGDLYFNIDTGRCDYRSNVDCDMTDSTAAPPASAGAPAPSDDRSPSAERVRSAADPVCPQLVGPFPVLLPNPTNCSTYYMCSGGVPVLLPCPHGLLFNNRTWTCDFPEHVVCPELYEIPDTEVTKSDPSLVSRSSSEETPVPSDQCPKVDGKYPVLLPNRDDCGSFYMCSHGVAFLKQCPTGLLFNNDTWNCDYPENVRCHQSDTLAASRPMTAAARRPVSLKLTFDSGCPAVDGRHPVFLSNPKNCSTYYMCSHGVPYLNSCPPGLEFNNRTWTCDFPWRARCTETRNSKAAEE